jgi:hypothetical protein
MTVGETAALGQRGEQRHPISDDAPVYARTRLPYVDVIRYDGCFGRDTSSIILPSSSSGIAAFACA